MIQFSPSEKQRLKRNIDEFVRINTDCANKSINNTSSETDLRNVSEFKAWLQFVKKECIHDWEESDKTKKYGRFHCVNCGVSITIQLGKLSSKMESDEEMPSERRLDIQTKEVGTCESLTKQLPLWEL